MSLTKRIIPCLDIDAGRVVKGVNFTNLIDAGDPVDIAKYYDQQGADELAFLDITASSNERETIVEIVEAVASQVFIPLMVGGGLRDLGDIQGILNAGADKVSINTAAVKNPDLISSATERFGSQCIVVSIDAKASSPGKWQVYTHGGRQNTGLDAVSWAISMAERGAGEIMLTSMDKDGTREGFDLALVRTISNAVDIPVIASGGVGSLEHLAEGIKTGKADAVLAASIFHFGEYSIAEAKQFMADQSIAIRP